MYIAIAEDCADYEKMEEELSEMSISKRKLVEARAQDESVAKVAENAEMVARITEEIVSVALQNVLSQLTKK